MIKKKVVFFSVTYNCVKMWEIWTSNLQNCLGLFWCAWLGCSLMHTINSPGQSCRSVPVASGGGTASTCHLCLSILFRLPRREESSLWGHSVAARDIWFSFLILLEARHLMWRRLGGTSSPYSSTLKGGYKEDGRSLFTRSHMAKARGDGYNLYQEKFHLHRRKIFFYNENTIHWSSLLRDVVVSPSLEVFKMELVRVPDNLIWAPFPMKVWTRW